MATTPSVVKTKIKRLETRIGRQTTPKRETLGKPRKEGSIKGEAGAVFRLRKMFADLQETSTTYIQKGGLLQLKPVAPGLWV